MKRVKELIRKGIGWIYLYVFAIRRSKVIKKSDLVFIFPYYHLGGAERVHLYITKIFENSNVTVIFTHSSATDIYLESFRESASIIILNPIINKRSDAVTKRLFKIIINAINQSKEISCVFGSNTKYFYEIVPFLNKRSIDLIHAFRDLDDREDMFCESARYLDKRVVISEHGHNALSQIYARQNLSEYLGNVVIIPNAVRSASLNQKMVNSSNEQIVVGYVGRWAPEKRPELFLKIAKSFQGKLNYIFVMAGSGMTAYKKVITDAGVIFKGQINNPIVLQELYKQLDVICITSEYEGFPMVIMESMMSGVIPISVNVGGVSEHIINGKNGVLIDNKDEMSVTDKMISSIIELKSDFSLRKNLSNNATVYAERSFSMDNFIHGYRALLKEKT
ncbi:glycosyltransferase family 4 protein [Nonlabens agnitus]|uniref:Glycosyl transferase family 1 domain-containing protein n=1 Tax=Nonlabens agnitus TaxID=870484 RepID=A0A2S9WU31_9FLAO|nr:glycosyltransferase family 4 protein [Nonlabens agnitus]PRP66992.1 hypothetical protein BST86_07710 [Nonlabens agnitus]